MALAALAIVALLGLAGVVLLRGNRARTGSLLVAAVAVGLIGADLVADLFTPKAMGAGIVRVTDPREWLVPDAVLGYRPRANTKVDVRETFDGKPVFHHTYTILADQTRATIAAPPGADTYVFLGDSFMFGEGLADDETVPSQFARLTGSSARTVNFSASGYAPNHLVRAVEAGLLDPYKTPNLMAMVTWVIPDHLARVTGDGGWLGSSPRYVLENGVPRFTGTFNEYRLYHPLEGLRYLLGQQFAFVHAIGQRQRQQEQADLFVALVVRLQALVRERFGVPLLVVYSWPDKSGDDPLLVSVPGKLRAAGVKLMRVNDVTTGHDVSKLLIPHDGHPTAFQDGLIAAELKRLLIGP
jgi:hypothetical protein